MSAELAGTPTDNVNHSVGADKSRDIADCKVRRRYRPSQAGIATFGGGDDGWLPVWAKEGEGIITFQELFPHFARGYARVTVCRELDRIRPHLQRSLFRIFGDL